MIKLSILTTITNPKERQDKFKEALECYKDLADEIVVVDGGNPTKDDSRIDDLGKIKVVYFNWPYEWNWVELPRHLNAGRKQCTGDWILKLDIDQFFHEKDFDQIRKKLIECPEDCQVATFQKMSMVYDGKYYQKGGQPIAFRNNSEIVIGKNLDKETDLCFPIRQIGVEEVIYKWDLSPEYDKGGDLIYSLPVGHDLSIYKTGIQYWNYDYFFKTKEFTRKEFWRFSRAYHRYFGTWKFGDSEEESFKIFINMQEARYKQSPYTYKLEDHSKYIREAVKNLTPEMFGYSGWK